MPWVQGIEFVTPALLAAFAVLPVLWILLRVTPPAPRIVRFPAIRLLAGLVPREETPARTPLWLILLRLLLASLLILGLAHPLVNPAPVLPGQGPVVLIVDNGWAAGPEWPARLQLLDSLLDRAERAHRQVAVVPTAPDAAQLPITFASPADARASVRTRAPVPWPTDRKLALASVEAAKLPQAVIYWLTDGIEDGSDGVGFARALSRIGPTTVVLPSWDRLPHELVAGSPGAEKLTATVWRVGEGPPPRLLALDTAGHELGQATVPSPSPGRSAQVEFSMPLELRNRVARIEIAGEAGAGATLLLDETSQRRLVGIASDRPQSAEQPLLSADYYLQRALAPFAEIRRGTVAQLIDAGVSMIVLPDGDPGPTESRDKLTKWVEAGGALLRFAGPLLAASDNNDLLPVTLRRGDRTIGGSLSWETPAHLAPFPASSPFSGLPVPQDVTVSRQVLAEPATDLPSKSWATLTDGTPIVTGAARGRGWVALVHTTADAAWSDLALSGLFVELLRRVEQLGRSMDTESQGVLAPWLVMDGYGRLNPASGSVRPLERKGKEPVKIGPHNPPGYYGTADAHRALNLSESVRPPVPLGELPGGIYRDSYVPVPEFDLRPLLLGGAVILALIDYLIGLQLRGLLTLPRRTWRSAAGAGLLLVLLGQGAQAGQDVDSYVLDATKSLRLAYVKTGDDEVDNVSKAGLNGLSQILTTRTSVDAGEPMAVDVEQDELIFFPLIYWPIGAMHAPLSAQAVDRVNRYLDTGGIILLDTQDQGTVGTDDPSERAQQLSTLFAGVHIPPLIQLPPDHVLTKSFYLLQDVPGRWDGGHLWVEPADARVNDGVSSVMVGSNDWAAAWAIDKSGEPLYPVVPGGEQQREKAYRFGVNLVMYALTGNYKADQVHVPTILERLGQ